MKEPPSVAGTRAAATLDILPHIERLDLLLQRQLHWQGQDPDDRLGLRELFVSSDEVDARLSAPHGQPAWLDEPVNPVIEGPIPACPCGRLADVVTRYGLGSLERDLLLLSLMPQIDERYGALFAFWQANDALRWPTLGSGLRLLCPNGRTRVVEQARLSAHSPLFTLALVKQKAPDEIPAELCIAPSIYHYLLGVDTRAAVPCADWLTPVNKAFDAQWIATLAAGWHAPNTVSPIVLLHDDVNGDASTAATAAAASAQRLALRLNLATLPENDEDARTTIIAALREVRLHNACLILDALPMLRTTRKGIAAELGTRLDSHPGPVVILGGTHIDWLGTRPHVVHQLPERSVAEIREWLQTALNDTYPHHGLTASEVTSLAQRYRPSPTMLATTLCEAELYRQQRGTDARLERVDLARAFGLRAQRDFGDLAQRKTPARTFDDLILTDDVQQQLHEVLAAINQREMLLAQGFARKLGNATGVSALFYGDSGTGKSMAAEVIANALGVDLIRVDLSTVVDKYIGETEKRLARIFDLAAHDAGVLFFDEADALFGKRTETKDAHDRYANIEVSYLLQRLESYPSLVILATNHRARLDDAFTRRLTFIVRFTFPQLLEREKMWRAIWPDAVRVADNIDAQQLAARAEITGGNIRNIALLAAWLAADAGASQIEWSHIDRALQRELAKIGRTWTPTK
ncbi:MULTISPECIES: ATP-binding protein [Burkholderiaceae]|uniref:ATP-binding protein n=1 Tax=Burkholderiaceae TaxID=119060 RepID=UPI00096895A1|nr:MULTISPECIES: ATP-binding protein [Burkholderiaceae]MCG1040892.1 ATP-binding protein [Mycetohabitans sp. B7]SIT64862.1 ATPase family associated with various cellular activities (AAA) [Burkholderia sp. b14]